MRAADVEEVRADEEAPEHYVRRLARAKALAVERSDKEVVLGADTVVVVDGEVLEKPSDGADAARMLRKLSGRAHNVITGFCLIAPSGEFETTESTVVRFLPLSDAEIAAYIASGEPMDKAGAYAIQGLASKFIDRVEGDYFNIVGLPVASVYRALKALGAGTNPVIR